MNTTRSMKIKELLNLLIGKNQPAERTVIWLEGEDGKRILFGKYPSDKNLNITVDSPATAEAYLELTKK